MVCAWLMSTNVTNPRHENQRSPAVSVTIKDLEKIGVLYWKIDVDRIDEEGKLEKIRKERNYTYEDQIAINRETLGDYENKLKMFYTEHLHADEEIRLFLDGSGYFDVRNGQDEWVRIFCQKGDLLVLPAGIYHRFTPDENDYAKVMRLFPGQPVWTAHNRPGADSMDARENYLKTFGPTAA